MKSSSTFLTTGVRLPSWRACSSGRTLAVTVPRVRRAHLLARPTTTGTNATGGTFASIHAPRCANGCARPTRTHLRAPRPRVAFALLCCLRGGVASANRCETVSSTRITGCLCWDIEKQPRSTKLIAFPHPIIGKSVVIYAYKPGHLARNILVPRRRADAALPPTKDVADAVA